MRRTRTITPRQQKIRHLQGGRSRRQDGPRTVNRRSDHRTGRAGAEKLARIYLVRRVVVASVLVLLLGISAVLILKNIGGDDSSLPTLTMFGELNRSLVSKAKIPGDGEVSDGALTTYRKDVRGLLEPVEPGVLQRGNTERMQIALTLDDGWNADERILDLLKTNNIKFTAFLIGGRNMVESHPEFVKAIVDAGGEVCGHTWSHYVMRDKSEEFVMNELWDTQNAITAITRKIVPYVRFSGGAYDQNALDWTAREGFWVVNWSVSDLDTAPGVTADTQVSTVLAGLSPGGILLGHWGGYNTYEVLSRLIPEIRNRGYEITSLSEVMKGTRNYLEPPAASSQER